MFLVSRLAATFSIKPVSDARNIEVIRPQNNHELFTLFDWADLVVIALKPNLHASGITVIQEATISGLPVICSRVGGLDDYFTPDEIFYVDSQDAALLRAAIELLTRDDARRTTLISNARQRLYADELTSQGYARRHVELSEQLLAIP